MKWNDVEWCVYILFIAITVTVTSNRIMPCEFKIDLNFFSILIKYDVSCFLQLLNPDIIVLHKIIYIIPNRYELNAVILLYLFLYTLYSMHVNR